MASSTAAYDARAAEYIAALGSMDAVHPTDRAIVDAWATTVRGRVLDAGCGPGHWTAHLAGLGCDVRGIDIVPGFLTHARAAYPGIPFDVCSIDTLDVPDGSVDGILSWFSTIHHEPFAIGAPMREFARVLCPGGTLLLGFFSGEHVEAFAHAVSPAYRWPPTNLHRLLDAAGFDVVETQVRETRGARPVGSILCARRSAS